MLSRLAVFAFVFSLCISAAASLGEGIVISQVLYNPAGTDSGGEAIELYNPSVAEVNITGWVISTETSSTDATVGTALMCGKCYYLIADSGWQSSKDNPIWPNADLEEAITLANTDAGVALKNANGVVVDAVGWGNPTNIGNGLFEGTPSPGSGNGASLLRRQINGSFVDTDNNSNDFIESIPVFSQNFVKPGNSADIIVSIVVSGSMPMLGQIILPDDDSLLPGNQISPLPNRNRTVQIEAIVSDGNGLPDIANVGLTFSSLNLLMVRKFDINTTAAIYSASFDLPSAFPAGVYAVNITAIDNANFLSTAQASFEYLSLSSFEVDTSSLLFLASPGSSFISGGNSTLANITIRNSGNALLDFDLYSSNFTSGTSILEASLLQYAFNGNYGNSSVSGNFTAKKVRKSVKLKPDAKAALSLRLSVPVGISPGNYSGKISLFAVNSQT